MSKKVEVFENEEAERFLDYFVAYKKFSSKADYLRCIIALNNEITSDSRNLQLAGTDHLDSVSETQQAVSLAPTHGEGSIPTKL